METAAIEMETKRIYRDSIFRAYFREPENFVQLCNAVTGLNLTADQVTENTVDDVIFSNPRNDVSFNAGNASFVFFEHQSTKNLNMPLRMLFYLSMLYRSIVPEDLIYKGNEIYLPAPRFFVFYNGRETFPEESTLKLSTAFSMPADIELNVHVYNVNYNKNFELLRGCRPIHDYSFFIDQVEINKRAGMTLEESVLKAMKTCIELGIMKDFLNAHKWEVFEVLSLVWNEEDAHKSYYAQGLEQGREEGREESKFEMIKNLLLAKTPMKYIIQASGLSKEEILKINNNVV